ncbi:hypothetical protein BDV93DRAFT_522354 [Ceratobasidium sp. AG-I]|nr:hypothetical protein BDV93DRAFT_522354 [Ceratobasidium sp. AG-I]
MYTNPVHPRTLTWQYWTLLAQLTISVYYLVQITLVITYSAPWFLAFLFIYALLILNAIFMLTFDYTRTDTYGGTIVGQTAISVVTFATHAAMIGVSNVDMWFASAGVLVPSIVSMLCSLYMIISLLLAKRKAVARSADFSWASNTKDALLGTASSADRGRLSWLGRRRSPPLRKRDVSMFTYFWVVYTPKILFRRIRHVETKRFAFFQNLCALLFMIAIVIRAITALAQAQNKFETRTGTEECGSLPYMGNIRVLVRHQGLAYYSMNPKTGEGYSVSVQATARGTSAVQCEPQSQFARERFGQANWFEVFDCVSHNSSLSYTWLLEATYNLTIRSTNGTSLSAMRLPAFWLSDFTDTLQEPANSANTSMMKSVAPWLIAPLQLIAGTHLVTNVGLARRKFITSSLLRDIVVNLEPTYRIASLFPITTAQTSLLPDNQTATAILIPSLVSPLSYSNSLDFIKSTKSTYYSMPTVCAFIADYRSSTIFDAIGSIGGLFAILQGVHILLFGRPMFWGITGAKLINPFGILGRCHSRDFRRRLRERYHYQPVGEHGHSTGDPSDTIRMNAFLRDFIIDFGPADIDEDPEQGQKVAEGGAGGRSEVEHNDAGHAKGTYDIPLLPHFKSRQDSEGSYLSLDTIVSKDPR